MPHDPQGSPATAALLRWTLHEAGAARTMEALLAGYCALLLELGVPLKRANLPLRALHPLARVAGWTWWMSRQGPRTAALTVRDFDATWTAQYEQSPFPAVLDRGVDVVRRRLEDPACPMDYSVLPDLREAGLTDFVVLGGDMAGERVGMTFASAAPGGFNDAHLAILREGMPALLLHVALHQARALADTLARTYLGPRTGPRVLSGEIRRGEVQRIDAVVGFCDLRGFTVSSAASTPEEVTERLNRWFDAIDAAVAASGGEILKFIGDAALVIWPVGNDAADACTRAVAAARALATALPSDLSGGLALHRGEVAYGNIGAAARLDFTVIGAAVNLASRLEGLCGRLGVPWLVSDAVASQVREPLADLGEHALKGVPEPVRAWGPAEPQA